MHIKHEICTTNDSRGPRTTTFIHLMGNTLSLDISYPGGLCCLFMTKEQAMGVAIGILEALHKDQRTQDAAIGVRASLFPDWLAEAMENPKAKKGGD